MTNNVSHVQGRQHSSEYVQNILRTQDTVNVVPEVSEKESQCHYKQAGVFQFIRRSKDGSPLPTDIQCDNNCNIELTLADAKNKLICRNGRRCLHAFYALTETQPTGGHESQPDLGLSLNGVPVFR